VKHLVDLVGELDGLGGHFRSLTDLIDTSTASGRFFWL
jgi:DNA invertase Pin-like site-specific DNA recombinase